MSNEAKEIRKDWINRKKIVEEKPIQKIADQIFIWILAIFKKKVNECDFDPITILLYEAQTWLEAEDEENIQNRINVKLVVEKYGASTLLNALKELINSEEGYLAECETYEDINGPIYKLTVSIKDEI